MKSLIWKELRENLGWVPLPSLVILLVFLIEKPSQPVLDTTDSYFFCLTAVVFGLGMGFLQVIFEAHGDKRSVLLHRPLTPSRVFAAKAVAGIALYMLALAIPFLSLESWYAAPGNMAAPYQWRTSLPWLADILSGLVYYFAGMLVAQREARWFGSRGLALATAFCCSYFVWALPEFWQVLLAIGIFSLLMGAAAWGNFCTGGAYPPLPRLAKLSLGTAMLLGLLILSMLGKQMLGEWLDPGMHYQVDVDDHGRLLYSAQEEGRGLISLTDVDGRDIDFRSDKWTADFTFLEWPVHSGYRHNGRFYVECRNHTTPANERWFYDQKERRLVGYDAYYHHSLGSFGPDGFHPPGEDPGPRFSGKFIYGTNRAVFMTSEYLTFPDAVYFVDYVGRAARKFFTSAPGEMVRATRWWKHDQENRPLVVVSTNQAFHIVTEDGLRVAALPRTIASDKYGPIFVGTFVNPKRYYVWYQLKLWLREPEEYRTEPSHLFEYDASGRELASRVVPPIPYPATPYAQALYGLVTPMAEAASLVGASKYVRSLARANGSTQKYSVMDYLEGIQYYVPGTSTMATALSPAAQPPSGLVAGYLTLMLLAAAASALGCFVLARRHAFSRALCLGWALVGLFFGWVGLVLMLALQEWPARIPCPKCQKFRVVTLEKCEHCGAAHAVPPQDNTEVFESTNTAPCAALNAS
jgi:hypothetical protein